MHSIECLSRILLLLTAMSLSACGGGSDSAVCADFRFQQDAQAAFRGGAGQLDADKDGIACENLPSR